MALWTAKEVSALCAMLILEVVSMNERPAHGPVLIVLESAPENMVAELALDAAYLLPGLWNGFSRPVASAACVGDFLDRWRRNDPNGEWFYATEVGDALLVTREDPDCPDKFPRVDSDSVGAGLFDLTGWVWVELVP